MNRLEYLAHSGEPEEIIEEVMSALNRKDREMDDLEEKLNSWKAAAIQVKERNKKLELENFELNKGVCFLKQEIDELRAEAAALRKYGNKDCTAMADAELRQE